MKPKTLLALTLSVLVAVIAGHHAAGAEEPETIELFDGESLDGWRCHNVDDLPMEEVWMVEDGVLRTVGEPFGYLYTEDSFESFELLVEWRWPEDVEPTNSGVLLRIADEPVSFLTQCVEAQLMHGSVGDIWAFYGANASGDEERAAQVEGHEALGDFHGVRKMTDAELPPGEWNVYEITLDGPDLTLVLNGEKVNEATDLDVLAGPIGFQSEGGPIEFRRIELTPLDE